MAACSFTLSPQQLANGVELVVQGNDILASYGPDSTPESTQQSTDTNKSSTRSRPWSQEETDALLTFVQSMGTTEHYIWTECSDYLKSLNISRTALSCVRRYNQIVREQEEDMGVEYVGKTRAIQVQTEVSIPPSEEVTWTQKISKPTVFGPFSSMVELEEFLHPKPPPQGQHVHSRLFPLTLTCNSITNLDFSSSDEQLEPILCEETFVSEDELLTEEYNPFSDQNYNPLTDHTYGIGLMCVLQEPVIEVEESHLGSGLKRPVEESGYTENIKQLRLDEMSRPDIETCAVHGVQPTDAEECIIRVESAHESPSLSNLIHNLNVCSQYITMEHNMLKTLLACGSTLKTIVDLEESFLFLSSYPKCCEGMFYLSVFQVQGQVYLRYIESGSYRGSFASVRDLIYPILPISGEGAVWSQVYIKEDIHHLLEQKLKNPNRIRCDLAYRRHMSGKKGNIKMHISVLQDHLKRSGDDCEMLGLVVHTKYSRHQKASAKNMSDTWYIHCLGSLERCQPQLKEFFQQYPVNNQPCRERDLSYLLQNQLPEKVSLQDQCDAISLIPNYPKSKPKSFGFVNKVPLFNKCPFSPRGKIIWACCGAKRDKYLQDTCVELCPEIREARAEDVLKPAQHMDHEDSHPCAGAPNQSFRNHPYGEVKSILRKKEKQRAADNLARTIALLEYPV